MICSFSLLIKKDRFSLEQGIKNEQGFDALLDFLTQLFAGKRRFAGDISFCRRLSGLVLLPGFLLLSRGPNRKTLSAFSGFV